MVCLALLETRKSFGLSVAAIFFLFGHIAFYSSCIDATTYIYSSEIFPTHLRARGISLSLTGPFLASLTFTQAATSALTAIGWKYYLLFAILCCMMVAVLVMFFPETKGLSLEEISKLFGDPVAVPITAMTEEEGAALDEELDRRGSIVERRASVRERRASIGREQNDSEKLAVQHYEV